MPAALLAANSVPAEPRVCLSEDLVALGGDNNIIRSSASHMLTGSVSGLLDTISFVTLRMPA